MSERNYWQRMKRRQLSRRTLLRASARAGVGATGLALVGCGDDDDDGQQTVAQAQQQDQQQQQAMQQQADQQDQQQAMQQQAQQQQQQQAMQQQQAEQQAQAATQQEEVAEEIAEGVGEVEEEWSMPRPLDEVDLDAEIVIAVGSDSGGLDHHRTGSAQNYISHGAVYSGPLDRDPRDNSMYAGLATPEWIDPVTLRLDIIPAKFHDGSTLVAGDMVFSYDRMGGLAEYHQGGETSDHPGGWVPAYPARSALNWVRNEAPDDRTWSIELPAPDAGFLTVNMDGSGEVTIHSQADTEGRGDLALDQEPMGTGPFRFVGHTDDENFIFERFDDHYNPIDYPVRVSHVPHHRRLTGLVRPELQSRLAGLEAGEIDVIHEGVGVNAAKPYIDDPNYTVQFQPGAGWSVHNIYPNLWQETTPDGDPNPFLDIRVRQAANHAINRRAIIDNLFLGVGDMSMLVYSGVPGYPSPEEKAEVVFDYNVEKAKQLMAEAGYEDGFDVPLYYTPTGAAMWSPIWCWWRPRTSLRLAFASRRCRRWALSTSLRSTPRAGMRPPGACTGSTPTPSPTSARCGNAAAAPMASSPSPRLRIRACRSSTSHSGWSRILTGDSRSFRSCCSSTPVRRPSSSSSSRRTRWLPGPTSTIPREAGSEISTS